MKRTMRHYYFVFLTVVQQTVSLFCIFCVFCSCVICVVIVLYKAKSVCIKIMKQNSCALCKITVEEKTEIWSTFIHIPVWWNLPQRMKLEHTTIIISAVPNKNKRKTKKKLKIRAIIGYNSILWKQKQHWSKPDDTEKQKNSELMIFFKWRNPTSGFYGEKKKMNKKRNQLSSLCYICKIAQNEGQL